MRQSRKVTSESRSTAINGLFEEDLAEGIEAQREYLEKLKVQRSKTQKLFQQYEAVLREKKDMAETITSLQVEIQRLKNKESFELRDKTERVRKLEIERDELRTEVDRLMRDKTKSLHEVKDYYDSCIQDLMTQTDQLRASDASKAEAISKLNLQLASRQQKINALEERFSSMASSKATERQAEQEKYESSQRQLSSTRNQLSNFRKKYEDLQSRFKEESQLKYQALRIKFQNTQQKEKLLNVKLQQLRKSRQKEEDEISAQVNGLKDSLDEKDRTIRLMKEQHERVQTDSMKSFTKMQIEIDRLNTQNTEIRERLSTLQSSYDYTRMQTEIAQYMKRIRELEMQLDNKDDSLAELTNGLLKIQEERDNLLNFFKQRQQLERERRELVEHEFQEINKFQKLLKHV